MPYQGFSAQLTQALERQAGVREQL